MDQREYGQIIKTVFSHSPSGSDELANMIYYTYDGVLGIAGDSKGTLGFGIASKLRPTREVLSCVDQLNRTMTFGHYWLAEGSDDSHLSLVCGFKFVYDSTSAQDLMDIAVGLMQHSGSLVEACRRQLGAVPCANYWHSDIEPGAQALVLTGHLG